MANVLIACEESQAVCKEFRRLGHNAFSCDILPCSGGHPEWHIQGDVLEVLNPYEFYSGFYGTELFGFQFSTCDGAVHIVKGQWDAVIAFPPCTHLAVSGAKYFAGKREDGRQRDGLEFFCKFLNLNCKFVSIENPVNIVSGEYVKKWFPDLCKKYGLPLKPTQSIQPYMFGHECTKKTNLWLKGFPPLAPTDIVGKGNIYQTKSGKNFSSWIKWGTDENGKVLRFNDPRTATMRSKTFPGIAKAMAEQWGALIGGSSE